MNKKNILELISLSRVAKGISGGDRVIMQIAKGFASDQDKKIFIGILRDDPALASNLKTAAHKLNIPNFFIEMNNKADLRVVFKLRKIMQELNITILHTHGYKADIIGFFSSRGLGIKLISTVHGWIEDSFFVKIYNIIDKIILRGFDLIVVVCEKFKSDLRRYGIRAHKIKIIHNGIAPGEIIKKRSEAETKDLFKITGSKKVITAIGRLSLEKGHKYFLAAAKELALKNQELIFLIAGDGPLAAELKEKAAIYNIADKVIFAGFRDDIADIISISDIIVLPSLSEGFPLVILEAMSLGKPVVATDVGDVKLLVKNAETGFCIQPLQVDALVVAINNILTDSVLAGQMAKQAKALIASEYKIENTIKKYKEIYESD